MRKENNCQAMRTVEEIKQVIKHLEDEIVRIDNYLPVQSHIKEEDVSKYVSYCRARINALKWVILERTTYL